MLGCTLEALSCERVHSFVLPCKENDVEWTTAAYFDWVAEVDDPVYVFLYQMCFTFSLEFHLYNEAVQMNNSTNMMASRSAFAPLCYGIPHPKYR